MTNVEFRVEELRDICLDTYRVGRLRIDSPLRSFATLADWLLENH